MAMTEERLLNIVNAEFEQSLGSPGGDEEKLRKLAWNRYLQKPMGNEIEGESQLVTSDVADVVDGLLPPLIRLFTTSDNIVGFSAVGKGDESAAEQETDYVTHTFKQNDDAFMTMFFWFFDALLSNVGVVVGWWDEDTHITQESYDNYSIEQLAPLFADENLEAQEQEENEDGTFNIVFNRINKTGKVSYECVPPSEYRTSKDTTGNLNPAKRRMNGREKLVPRSDLIEMGFDPKQVEELSATKPQNNTSNPKTKEDQGSTLDKSQEYICLREAYIKVDFDEDGRSELRQVFTGAGKLLKWKDGKTANSIVDRQPFHELSAAPLPGGQTARSPGMKVIDLQDTTTTVLRQTMNNVYHTNNPGHAVWDQGMTEDTLDDLLSTRVGSVKRFARPPSESYMPLTVPFTAGTTFEMMGYFDKVKRARTGITDDGDGLDPAALKHIQQSVLSQATDLNKMKIEVIARIFAETGIKSLFRHIHELLQKHQNVEEVVKLRNEYVPVNPTEWKTRNNMTVNIGLGVGTRDQNRIQLDSIWEKQMMMAQGGGMNLTVTPKNIYNTAVESVKNANYKTPEMFFTDPKDKPAPPPSDEQEALQKQEQELEARRQQLDGDRNSLNEKKLQLQAQENQLDHQTDQMKLREENEKREDKLFIENEKLRNDLAEMQLKVEKDEREWPFEREKLVKQIQNLEAQSGVAKATTIKILEDARAQDLETDAAESGLLEALTEEEELEEETENGE